MLSKPKLEKLLTLMKSQQNIVLSQESSSDGLSEIKDRILLRRAIYQRDRQAQEYIFIKYGPFIRQFIKNMGNFDEQVYDLVQDVFVNVCAGKCQYSGNTDVRGYLCGIAKNVVQNHIRKKKRQVRTYLIRENDTSIEFGQPNSKVNNPEKTLELKEIREALHEAIARLPEKSRQAVELVLVYKIRPHQAAAKVGCPSIVFRNRLHRGLKKLREELCKFSNFCET